MRKAGEVSFGILILCFSIVGGASCINDARSNELINISDIQLAVSGQDKDPSHFLRKKITRWWRPAKIYINSDECRNRCPAIHSLIEQLTSLTNGLVVFTDKRDINVAIFEKRPDTFKSILNNYKSFFEFIRNNNYRKKDLILDFLIQGCSLKTRKVENFYLAAYIIINLDRGRKFRSKCLKAKLLNLIGLSGINFSNTLDYYAPRDTNKPILNGKTSEIIKTMYQKNLNPQIRWGDAIEATKVKQR